MKTILNMLLVLLLCISCDRTEYVEVLSYDIEVENPLYFNHKSGETVVLMGKMISSKANAVKKYQYFIAARGGTWIETNQRFHLGDTMVLNGIQPDDVINTGVLITDIKITPKVDTIERK